MDARDSLNGANRATFNEQPDYLSDLLSRQIGAVQLLGTLAVGLVALAATEPLITLAVFAESLAFDLAIMAGH